MIKENDVEIEEFLLEIFGSESSLDAFMASWDGSTELVEVKDDH